MTKYGPNVIRPLTAGGEHYRVHSLAAAEEAGLGEFSRLPWSLKVLAENLLRHCDGDLVGEEHVRAVGSWARTGRGEGEVPFLPNRVIMPDSSGAPLLADLAAMRDAMVRLGGDPSRINPAMRVDLVIDHSVMADVTGAPDAFRRNLRLEYGRNRERYEFIRWAGQAFDNVSIVPPGNGIIHQVNLEYLAEVVCRGKDAVGPTASFDTVLGMDSHTPMVNGIGVLGWGCGGIEAGAAMIGVPVSIPLPNVVGLRLVGSLWPGVTATDLVLTITERLRQAGVVQAFVECHGPGLAALPVPTRATVSNMTPEYGATVCFFPIDPATIAYLRMTGRDETSLALVEAHARFQGVWADRSDPEPVYTDVIEFDLASVEPSIAGPGRPQDRVPLSEGRRSVEAALDRIVPTGSREVKVPTDAGAIGHGDIAVAAITSCTNTSNPEVILAAALLARNAVARGLKVPSWVKTSFSPGSKAVAAYLAEGGLQEPLDALGFHIAGFGCMTCMGNSGPLDASVADAVDRNGLAMAAVLSGNRNFEGRVHHQCRINYLASPPLVVAYALAGTAAIDLTRDPLGHGRDGAPVYLRDIWPEPSEVDDAVGRLVTGSTFSRSYAAMTAEDPEWSRLRSAGGLTFDWQDGSTYIRRPPLFEDFTVEAPPLPRIGNARALAVLGDSVTTDHISPIGVILPESPAGQYLLSQGVAATDFNMYGARRANHDVLIRGTFASPRLRNDMADGRNGGYTRHHPSGEIVTIFEAAERYAAQAVPLIVVAGRDYGVGSSRDWAAKGPMLLGVRAVLAESFERIHRSNLIGMGILPLQFAAEASRSTLAITGSETFDLAMPDTFHPRQPVTCRMTRADGERVTFSLTARLDSAHDIACYRHRGFLPYGLRRMLQSST